VGKWRTPVVASKSCALVRSSPPRVGTNLLTELAKQTSPEGLPRASTQSVIQQAGHSATFSAPVGNTCVRRGLKHTSARDRLEPTGAKRKHPHSVVLRNRSHKTYFAIHVASIHAIQHNRLPNQKMFMFCCTTRRQCRGRGAVQSHEGIITLRRRGRHSRRRSSLLMLDSRGHTQRLVKALLLHAAGGVGSHPRRLVAGLFGHEFARRYSHALWRGP